MRFRIKLGAISCKPVGGTVASLNVQDTGAVPMRTLATTAAFVPSLQFRQHVSVEAAKARTIDSNTTASQAPRKRAAGFVAGKDVEDRIH